MDVMTTGLRFPEGPIALPDGGLLVVEMLGGTLTRVAPDGTSSVIAELGGGPNGAAIGPDGRCYVCNNGGYAAMAMGDLLIASPPPIATLPGSIQVVDLATGAFETLYASCDNAPFWAPNDIIFDREGGFWFTDFGRQRGRFRQTGSVYYAKADGSLLREMIHPVDAANGIGLSPDGSTLYVANTFEGHLLGYRLSAPGEIDPAGGHMPDGSFIVGRAGAGQYLDSLAVDSSGRVVTMRWDVPGLDLAYS